MDETDKEKLARRRWFIQDTVTGDYWGRTQWSKDGVFLFNKKEEANDWHRMLLFEHPHAGLFQCDVFLPEEMEKTLDTE